MALVIDRIALVVSFAHVVADVDGGRRQSYGPHRGDRWGRPSTVQRTVRRSMKWVIVRVHPPPAIDEGLHRFREART